ncbi:MAG TPA: alpha/beta fold hydrolase [Pirellulales bacterium]|jgi:dienelactone hydrolase|nr:alpha/beta fold hydrolase [Pirellulales bacterium]
MPRWIRHTARLTGLVVLGFALPAGAADKSGPWNLVQLKQTPEATWGETKEGVQEVLYEGEPFEGHPTHVFAYYARPQEGDGPFPAVLLVHGGGGKAFAEWVRLWADRGYAALAMDLAGHGADGQRLPDGGPEQDDRAKFRSFTDDEVDQMWTYHAVAAVIRGGSLLASREEVDAGRLGITGISWGGYLTCIVAGLDDRLKVAVPVYGCGYLAEDSVWKPTFDRMSADQRQRWVDNFDPSNYLPNVRCPILFINGTNDYSYPLDSWQKSYRLVPGRVDLCLKLRMPHSHPDGWAPEEIGIYVDSILQDGRPPASIERARLRGNRAVARFTAAVPIMRAEAHFAVASGPWNKRGWQTASAVHTEDTVSVELPAARPLAYYLSITDGRGAQMTTQHEILEE